MAYPEGNLNLQKVVRELEARIEALEAAALAKVEDHKPAEDEKKADS